MEAFVDNMIIRIKNDQGKYLIAEQDEESVSKSRNGSTKNAQWTVKVNDQESLYLKSCYGRYLTASNKPSIPGMVAKNLKVTQTAPVKKNTSHQWLPVTPPGLTESHSVWLQTPHGSYLRTHTGRNLITHDLLRKHGPGCPMLNKKILWHVEIADSPSDQWKHSEPVASKMLFHAKSFVSEKKKDKGLKVEKEIKKGRISKNIVSRKLKLNSKSC